AKKKLMIGIPEGNNARDGTTITNAHLGYIHENGSPAQGIPARPFLKPGVENARAKVVDYLQQGANRAIKTRDVHPIDIAMHAAGQVAVASVQAVIKAKIPPPLQPATVAARRRRSQGSRYRRKATAQQQAEFNTKYASGQATMAESPTTPLWDTGSLLRSITYVIRDG
ncbi:MAG TPA: hypothetical protein VGD41_09360, partial [Pyrinomonadaceae bacterium]